MHLLRLLFLLLCFIQLIPARPRSSTRHSVKDPQERENIVPQRSRKFSNGKCGNNKGISASTNKHRHDAETKPVRRFLGGIKATTNLTSTTTFAPKLNANKQEGKTTKYTSTFSNNFPSRTSSLSSIPHKSLSSVSHQNSPNTITNSQMYLEEAEKDYGNDRMSARPEPSKSAVESTEQYSRMPGIVSSNSPYLPHGMVSTSMTSMTPNEMISKPTSSSSEIGSPSDLESETAKYENNWPLFSIDRNGHTEQLPIQAFYGPNSYRNHFREQMDQSNFRNASRFQNTNDMVEPIMHNLDPSVKYSVAAPNVMDKIPSFSFAGLPNDGNFGSVHMQQEHKDAAQVHPGAGRGLALQGESVESYGGIGSSSPTQLPGYSGEGAQTASAYTDLMWTSFEGKVEPSPNFSITEVRSISDSQSECFPVQDSELAPLYSMSHSSDMLSNKPAVSHMDLFGGRYNDDKTDSNGNANTDQHFQDTAQIQQQDASCTDSNAGGNNTPLVESLPSSSFAPENLIGHKDLVDSIVEGELGVIGSQTGYHSESGFEITLETDGDHHLENRQSSSSNENLYDPMYTVNSRLQKFESQEQETVSFGINTKFNFEGTEVGEGNFKRFLQPAVQRRSYTATNHSKHKT